MEAIDINITEVKSDGIAYYRLPDDVYEFFKKVSADRQVIGFEWDGSRNFGLITKIKEPSHA